MRFAAAASAAAQRKSNENCNSAKVTAHLSTAAPARTFTTKTTTRSITTPAMHHSFRLVPIILLLLLLLQQQHAGDCRYLPTRSNGDDLDKLRELMLQILESSNEEQQQQRPPNEANGNTLAQRANWWNKLNAADGALDVARKPYSGRLGYDVLARY